MPLHSSLGGKKKTEPRKWAWALREGCSCFLGFHFSLRHVMCALHCGGRNGLAAFQGLGTLCPHGQHGRAGVPAGSRTSRVCVCACVCVHVCVCVCMHAGLVLLFSWVVVSLRIFPALSPEVGGGGCS